MHWLVELDRLGSIPSMPKCFYALWFKEKVNGARQEKIAYLAFPTRLANSYLDFTTCHWQMGSSSNQCAGRGQCGFNLELCNFASHENFPAIYRLLKLTYHHDLYIEQIRVSFFSDVK